MANESAVDLGQVAFPRTYREKLWRSAGSALFGTALLWWYASGSEPYVIYLVLAFFLFMMLDVIVTRTVLYEDRIERIHLLGRWSLCGRHRGGNHLASVGRDARISREKSGSGAPSAAWAALSISERRRNSSNDSVVSTQPE